MTLSAFFIIFISVLLHAGWNLLSKKNSASGLRFYMQMALTSAVFFLPFYFLSALHRCSLPPKFYYCYFIATCGEVLYMGGIFLAYRRMEVSRAYPILRSLPVLLVAGCTTVMGFGKPLTAAAVGGMVLIVLGCLLLPQHRWLPEWRCYLNRGFLFILMAACGTTIYTLADAKLMETVKLAAGRVTLLESLGYVSMMEGGLLVGELLMALLILPDQRRELLTLGRNFAASPAASLRRFRLLPSLNGIASSSAYVLVLLAMPMVTNVSILQAFRQMSLPIGFLAGVFLLKEEKHPAGFLGMGLIAAGLVTVALAS